MPSLQRVVISLCNLVLFSALACVPDLFWDLRPPKIPLIMPLRLTALWHYLEEYLAGVNPRRNALAISIYSYIKFGSTGICG